MLWLLFHLVVVFLEEPHLCEERGATYDEYGWVGRDNGFCYDVVTRVGSCFSSLSVAAAISWTAASKAGWLIFDGLWDPLTLRTNCRAAAEISSGVTGASGRRRTLMLRHII